MQRRIQSMIFAAMCVAVLASSQMVGAQDIQDIQELNRLQDGSPNHQAYNALLTRIASKARMDGRRAQIADPGEKDGNLALIQMMLNQPDESIDLAKVEVVVEHMIDPEVNQAETLQQLDTLAQNAHGRFPQGDATDTEEKGLILTLP